MCVFQALQVSKGNVRGIAYATGALTAGTLFFGELLPKAIGVNNAERTARLLAPGINVMALVLGPVGTSFAKLSKKVLELMGSTTGSETFGRDLLVTEGRRSVSRVCAREGVSPHS